MTTDPNTARSIAFLLPLVCTLVCLALSALDTKRGDHIIRRKIHYRVIAMYVTEIVVWTGLVLHSISPVAFVWALPLWVFMVMLGSILYFRSICAITDTGGKLPTHCLPPLKHFIVPVILTATMLVLIVVFPMDTLLDVVYGTRGLAIKLFFLAALLAYRLSYPVMGLVEIVKYRRSETKSASDDHYKTLGWLLWSMILDCILLPFSIVGLLYGIAFYVNLDFWWLAISMPTVMICVVTCSNLLSGNYMVIEQDEIENPTVLPEIVTQLTRRRVEQYMDKKKPYLDSEFRITDMAEELFSNRAYVSAFINSEFGMHFTNFVNRYRLEELDRLREEDTQKNRRTPVIGLVINAGFSNYRSYLRAKSRIGETSDDAADPGEEVDNIDDGTNPGGEAGE